jgi:hypothetical protein
MYTFHLGDSKVYMVTNLKLQGSTPLVSVALLTGVCSQYVGPDLSYLLFGLCHNVETKNNSFTRFGPAQRCTAGLSLECLIGWHLDALLIAIVIWELSERKILIPLRTIIQDPSSKHIFNDLVHSLGLAIGLRIVGWTSDEMVAKVFMKLFSEMCYKDRSSVKYDSLRNTMIADDVGNV